MVSPTRLNDAFGELIYAVAISDGMIQEAEVETLQKFLAEHPRGKDIQWSFDYERQKGNSLMDTYNKALESLKENGPHPDYAYLVGVLEAVAEANAGFQKREGQLISNFQKSLRAHFLAYLDEHQLLT